MSATQHVASREVMPTASAMSLPGRDRILYGLTILAVLGFIGALYMALGYAGTDAVQGNVQRIFYMHLGAFVGASVAFSAAFVGGVAYLRTGKRAGIRWRWQASRLAWRSR